MKFRYILPIIILILTSCKNQNNEISINEESKILSNKATEFIVKEDYKKATDLSNKAIEKDSKNYYAYIGQTTISIRQKNYKLALKQIEKVIEIKPDFAESWTMKGMLNDILNNKEQASRDYEKSIKYFENRKGKENFDEKNNDINIYYSLYLIDNHKSKEKIRFLQKKWINDQNMTAFFASINEYSREETLNKILKDK